MSRSNIEWTTETWNPVVGCSILSPGCTNCYAMKMAARIEAMNIDLPLGQRQARQYEGTTEKVNGHTVWTGKLAMAGENVLLSPLKRKKPTTYFVNSMGDLFHEDVPDMWIDRVFAVMALTPQHTYQILTKRAQQMRDYFAEGGARMHTRWLWAGREALSGYAGGNIPDEFPLKNVWLGVSAERQQEAEMRIPLLLQTPAAVRFISAEPLLGPIDLTAIKRTDAEGFMRPLDGRFRTLDWVIVGGESGPGARPMHPAWARSLRNQCSAAGVPFFFKQWGENIPIGQSMQGAARGRQLSPEFFSAGAGEARFDYARVGKKAAGRALDGMIHNEMPGQPEGGR